MEGFREVVDYCGFIDLSYSGLPYMWDNHRQGVANIKVHLDQALANQSWLDMIWDTIVQHIQMTESDHCGLLVRSARGWFTNGVAAPVLSVTRTCGEGITHTVT
jgi:hypothetical protein